MKSILLSLLFVAFAVSADEYKDERGQMVSEIRYFAGLARDAGARGFAQKVMHTMRKVERHEFVPERQKRFAYENRPLPIGHGQTISQPYIVALMTDLVDPKAEDVVLEVGTASGYQAAVLAELVDHVYTIEIIEPLFSRATARLERLGYNNVTTRLGDGYYGWEQHGPFDSIVVTAAASHVPPPLIRQLKPGGRMVIPVGGHWLTQQLLLIRKTDDGEIITRQIASVRFVPLTGEH